MPRLHNPHGFDLSCYVIGRLVPAGDEVEITDAEAEVLRDGPVFVVSDAVPSEKPVRERARRGGKRVEVSTAPRRETRISES